MVSRIDDAPVGERATSGWPELTLAALCTRLAREESENDWYCGSV